MNARKILLIVCGGAAALTLLIISQFVCLSAWFSYGMVVAECPDGEIRQGVALNAYNLRRGTWGTVHCGAIANYTTGPADSVLTAPIGRLSAEVFLVRDKEEIALKPKKDWKSNGDGLTAQLKLPKDLPDGDYALRAKVSTAIGKDTLDVPLRVYAPAKVHVLTDRPLYEAGNTVMFRAAVLRARDLAPLDHRPGKWFVTDPTGEVLLEERAPAGEYGIVSGTFPLDTGAMTGDWRVRWESGAAKDEVTFRVEPFTLPRFRVEATPSKPYYRSGDRPKLRGQVLYSSGAPVADARIELNWSISGGWPAPTGWMTGGLPQRAVSAKNGRFELQLPVIPVDLRGRATLSARIAAVDPAGDRVESSAAILLSKDAIKVAAVTELGDGLVKGFNNRVYIRATTASGTVLSKTELTVKRAWEPTDKGVKAVTDEDGVASLQLDPGPPINVVLPPMPARPPPKVQPIVRGSTNDMITGAGASLADQVEMDKWNRPLAPCARFVSGSSDNVGLALQVDALGNITSVTAPDSPLLRCMQRVLGTKRLPSGRARIYEVYFQVNSDLPVLRHDLYATPEEPQRFSEALQAATLDARSCLPDDINDAEMPRVMLWRLKKGSQKPTVSFATDPQAGPPMVRATIARCIESKMSTFSLPPPSPTEEEEVRTREYLGYVRFNVEAAQRVRAATPQATTMLGYELMVSARAGKEEVGSTKLILNPGSVPHLRLRATPVLADPGDKVKVVILRGPQFRGKLPKKLYLSHEQGSVESLLNTKTRTAEFQIPKDGQGWFEVSWSGARALVYVRSRAELTLAVDPDKDRYAPGDTAQLGVTTLVGGEPKPAAVGLFGVDESLSQLMPLPGPNDMARVREKAKMQSPAFGVLDVEALAMGRIRGSHAAAATILRVSSIPTRADIDSYVTADGRTTFEPLEALTDHFYTVLSELHAEVRRWEKAAPKKEQMHPRTMARLWQKSLAACEKRGDAVTDAYGRKLRLSRLPEDLLALVEPRAVVITGTRLPEDIENWRDWVRKERP